MRGVTPGLKTASPPLTRLLWVSVLDFLLESPLIALEHVQLVCLPVDSVHGLVQRIRNGRHLEREDIVLQFVVGLSYGALAVVEKERLIRELSVESSDDQYLVIINLAYSWGVMGSGGTIRSLTHLGTLVYWPRVKTSTAAGKWKLGRVARTRDSLKLKDYNTIMIQWSYQTRANWGHKSIRSIETNYFVLFLKWNRKIINFYYKIW